MDTLIALFTVIVFLPGSCQQCPSSWLHYRQDNVCIKVFNDPPYYNWPDSRTFCQNYAGDLVQIWNREKSRFVKGMDSSFNYFRYWIGARDEYRDGAFKYVNGTIVAVPGPGIGHWHNPKDPDRGKDSCVSMAKYDRGWNVESCRRRYRRICEKSLNKKKTVGKRGTSCSLRTCSCKKRDWLYYEEGDKYLVVNYVARTFSVSSQICVKLGGQLLTVPGRDTASYMKNRKDWWIWTHVLFWIGLSSQGTSEWHWIDGTPLDSNEFQNWFLESYEKKGSCAAVIWDYDGKWRSISCNSEQYQICEATIPCATRPVMNINNSTILANSSAKVHYQQRADIACVLNGYTELTNRLALNCTGNETTTDADSVHLSIVIDFDTHGQICQCTSTHSDGDVEEVYRITFDVQYNPHLMGESENITTTNVTLLQGRDHVVQFYIKANPPPDTKILRKLGSDGVEKDILVVVKPTEKTFEHVVLLILTNVGWNIVGSYHLLLSNGIPENLDIYLNFNVKNRTLIVLPKLTWTKVFPYMVMGALSFLLICLAGVGFYHALGKDREYDSDSSFASTSIDELEDEHTESDTDIGSSVDVKTKKKVRFNLFDDYFDDSVDEDTTSSESSTESDSTQRNTEVSFDAYFDMLMRMKGMRK